MRSGCCLPFAAGRVSFLLLIPFRGTNGPQLLQSKNVLPRSGATLMPLRSVESGAGGGGVHAAAGCCASGGTVPMCRSGHGCAVWLLSHRAHTWCCFQTRFVAPVLVPCQTAASPVGSASGRRGPL